MRTYRNRNKVIFQQVMLNTTGRKNFKIRIQFYILFSCLLRGMVVVILKHLKHFSKNSEYFQVERYRRRFIFRKITILMIACILFGFIRDQ